MTERLTQIRYDELPPEVRPLADDILMVSSAALGGPYNALLRSPDMARRAFDFLDYLRFRTSVNKRLNGKSFFHDSGRRFRFMTAQA